MVHEMYYHIGMIISIATWALYMSQQHTLMKASDVLGNLTSFIPTYPASKVRSS